MERGIWIFESETWKKGQNISNKSFSKCALGRMEKEKPNVDFIATTSQGPQPSIVAIPFFESADRVHDHA
jgi:hypothetical protein